MQCAQRSCLDPTSASPGAPGKESGEAAEVLPAGGQSPSEALLPNLPTGPPGTQTRPHSPASLSGEGPWPVHSPGDLEPASLPPAAHLCSTL